MAIFSVIDTGTGADTFYEGMVKDAANWAVLEAALSAATTHILVGGGAGTVPVMTAATGTGSPVRATSPTLVTPTIGVATATSVNKVTITAPATSATLTIANSKTLTVSETSTLTTELHVTAPATHIADGVTGFTIAGGTTSKTLTVTGDATISGTPAAGVASQTQAEAGTADTVAITPLSANWHPGVAKAWILAAGDGSAITVSHNITSVTDTGVGILTVTIATDFSSANYVIAASLLTASVTSTETISSQAAGSFVLQSAVGTPTDPTAYYAVCFGDQ